MFSMPSLSSGSTIVIVERAERNDAGPRFVDIDSSFHNAFCSRHYSRNRHSLLASKVDKIANTKHNEVELSRRMRSKLLDQNVQFYITVGTVIAVFLWLRNDINRLDAKIDREIDALKSDISSLLAEVTSLRTEVASIRESLGWMRGRMGFSEPIAVEKES